MASDTQLSRAVVVAVALLLLLPIVMMLFAWPFVGMGWWMHGPVSQDGQVGPGGAEGGTPTWMFGFWVVGLLIVVGVGYLLYQAVSGGADDPALEELRRAYARGDLSDEEFEERRERLQ